MAVNNKEFSKKALEDFELIEQAKQGNEQAFGELMKRYKKSVYYTILKMVRNVDDAEDLTIEAFAKAFRNIHKFNPKYTFSTWLFRVATNNCIDFIRKKKTDALNSSSSLSDSYDDDESSPDMDLQDSKLTPMEAAIKDQKIEIVQQIVDKLPNNYKKLVRLRYFKEFSYKEIAEELELPLGTVKTQLHRARELLHDMVKNSKHTI